MLVVHIDGTVFEYSRRARRVLKAAKVPIEPYFYEEIRPMTSQNETEKASKAQDKPRDDSALKAAKPFEVKQELTDDEIASIAGGVNMNPGFPLKPGG